MTSDPYAPAVRQVRSSFSAGEGVAGTVRSDGTVWVWGTDTNSRSLGTTYQTSDPPSMVTFPREQHLVQLSYTGGTAVATSDDGSVWVWGRFDPSGCDGETSTYPRPTAVPTPDGRTIVSASVTSTCTILELASDGTIWQQTNLRGNPVQVVLPGERKVIQLTKNSTVLASDGTIWGWGDNYNGRLGNGTKGNTVSRSAPVQLILPSGTSATQVAAGTYTTIFLLNNNTVWSVGGNGSGQMGVGTSTSSYTRAQQVKLPSGKTWTGVSAGMSATAGAVASDGTVYIAGYNRYGQLGNGSTTDSDLPVLVKNPSGVQFSKIDLASSQSYAVDQNGAFWGWGSNYDTMESSNFGYGDLSATYFTRPHRAGKNQQYSSATPSFSCASGVTPSSAGYCPPASDVTYSVSYSYLSWTAPSQSAQATSTAVQTGTAVIGGPGSSGKCLTIQGNGSADGTPVVLANCDSSATGQRWTTWSDGTFRANGECLDMKGSTPGTIVQLWNCNGEGYQWWVPRADGSMYNPTSQLCLTDPSGTAAVGTQQQISTCNGSASQQWKLTS